MADKDDGRDSGGMTELEKWRKGLPFDSAKLWQEMDDRNIDAIREGIRGHDGRDDGRR